MNIQAKDTNNPFLNNEPNSICVGCNRKLHVSQTVSVHEVLPKTKPSITLFEGLQRISNFAQLSIEQSPNRACRTCFLNADGFMRFQTFCNNSVANIQAYILHQENTKCGSVSTEEGLPHGHDYDKQLETCSKVILEDYDKSTNISIDEQQDEDSCEDSKQNQTNDVGRISHPTTILLPTKKENKGKKVECPICHKLFGRPYLKYHKRIHTGELPHKCKECGKAFVSPTGLWLHMKQRHCTDFKHLCPYCGSGHKLATRLSTHIRVVHTNERPYKCQICGKLFKTSQQRKHHLTTHSDERPFQCDKCPKRFSLRKLLKQHSVTHAEVRPIECTFCGKRFTQRHCLKSHQAKTCEAIHRI